MALQTESANSQESAFAGALGGLSGFLSEALTIEAAGYLNQRAQNAGIAPQPQDQLPTRTDSNGTNLTTESSTDQAKNWLMIGGAIALVLVVVWLLAGMRGK